VTLHGADGSLELEWRLFGGVEQGVVIRGCRHGEVDFQVLEIPNDYLQGVEADDIGGVLAKHLVGPRLFVDAIQHNYLPTPNFEQGFKVQQVLDAAMASHQSGERVQLDA